MSAILGESWAFQPFIHSMFAKNGEGSDQRACALKSKVLKMRCRLELELLIFKG